MEHSSEKALEKYLREHPKADRSKHTVRDTSSDAPAESEDVVVKKRYKEPSKGDIAKAKRDAKKTTWKKPDIDEEIGEIRRTAKAFGMSAKALREAAKKAKIENLDDKTWSKLENTDSFDTDTVGKAMALAKEYDRDIASVVKGIGGDLPAPIVLMKKGEPPYLIGGNTRLMAARAVGARPKVLMVRI